MTLIDVVTGLFFFLAILLFIWFIILLFRRYNVDELEYGLENNDDKINVAHKDYNKKIDENESIKIKKIHEEVKKTKTPFFKKNQNIFKNRLFFFSDLARDLSRFGKKREKRVNILYLDEVGGLHGTIGFLSHENVEFKVGGLQMTKGLNEIIREKIYVGTKMYQYFFIPFNFYENMKLNKYLEKDYEIDIENLERDRIRIIDNDITKTSLQMDDTQAGILRTTSITSALGGYVLGALSVVGLLFLFI